MEVVANLDFFGALAKKNSLVFLGSLGTMGSLGKKMCPSRNSPLLPTKLRGELVDRCGGAKRRY